MMTILEDMRCGSLQLRYDPEDDSHDVMLLDHSDKLGTIKYDGEVWQFRQSASFERWFFSFELVEIAELMCVLETAQFVISQVDDDINLSDLIKND